jgi:hypothetical protein
MVRVLGEGANPVIPPSRPTYGEDSQHWQAGGIGLRRRKAHSIASSPTSTRLSRRRPSQSQPSNPPRPQSRGVRPAHPRIAGRVWQRVPHPVGGKDGAGHLSTTAPPCPCPMQPAPRRANEERRSPLGVSVWRPGILDGIGRSRLYPSLASHLLLRKRCPI